MARSPIPGMIEAFHQMTEEERKCFLDLVDPQPEPEAPAKRTRKKRSAAPAATAAKRGLPSIPDSARCAVEGCGQLSGHPNHDSTYLSSHPFESSAPTASKRSGRKGAGTSSGANTEVEMVNATAVGASGD